MMSNMLSYAENFGNLRTQFYNKAAFSDLVLNISDTRNVKKPPLVIHTHFIVLYSASEYVRRCLAFSENKQQQPSCLNLQVDYARGGEESLLDDEMVRFFFSLFYVNRFDEEHLAEQGLCEVLHENILTLYDLAQYFVFDTLIVYIEQYFRETMCIAYFAPLTGYCLRRKRESNLYAVTDQERSGVSNLLRSLLQWYVCCVEPPLPSVESEALLKYENTPQYFAYHKPTILAELESAVEGIEQCGLPRKRARRLSDSTIHLEYYRKICSDCLSKSKKSNTVNAFYYLDMGCLSLEDEGEQPQQEFFMRLKKRLDQRECHGDNTIELTMTGNKNTEEKYRCRSQVSLLSRKKHNKDTLIRDYDKKNLRLPTKINSFETHSLKHCYEAKCDHCASHQLVYIMLLDISLSTLPTEDMSMSVEEACI